MTKIPHRITLSEEHIPSAWYNLRADMPNKPAPMLNPKTLEKAREEDLYPVFCKELSHQELDETTRFIDIPGEVMDMYKIYRPSPLIRAYNLEKELDTPAKIYFKFEGNNTSGSHKLNSAIAQAFYAKKQGVASLTTETGAGQWGTALSEACAYFKLPLKVFMVKSSSQQKPYRKAIMENFGASVIASPSSTTAAGRAILAEDPQNGGSLGKAKTRFVAVEPISCPSLTRGVFAYDYCDVGKITPLAKMYTLGCTFKPASSHAGGLRYHGMSPILSQLYHDGMMEAIAVEQTKVFEAAKLFARCETILPAPESAHAILGAVREAVRCREEGRAETILFGLTGTGYFDMAAYSVFNQGQMTDYRPTDEELEKSIAVLPKVTKM